MRNLEVMLIRQSLKIPLTKQWRTGQDCVQPEKSAGGALFEKCWQFFINIRCLWIAFKSCTKQGVPIFNVCSPLLWVLCIGKWGFCRFMVVSLSTGSEASTVQTSGVINLIKGLHMDAGIHRQETREWWEYFTACLSFNLSQWRWGEIYEDVWAGSAQGPAPSGGQLGFISVESDRRSKRQTAHRLHVPKNPRVLADLPGSSLILELVFCPVRLSGTSC